MEIKEWFKKGCDYQTGVLIYAQIGKNRSLLQLFQKKENDWNREKLKYELEKFLNTPVEVPKPVQNITEPVEIQISETAKVLKSKPISAYPVSLHKVYQRRISTFYQAASLKMELNEIPQSDSKTALKLQFQIWELIKENQKCWRILNLFDETGRVLPAQSESDFTNLSPQELVNQRQRLYVNKSKRNKTIDQKEKELAGEKNAAKRQKIEKFILKKKEEMQLIDNDIEKLTQMINA